MKIQVLIVLLVILALLLVVGLVLGPTLEKRPGRERSFIEWAKERGGAFEKKVRRSDLHATPDACLQGNTLVLAAGGSCQIEIDPADDNVRTITLELETPKQVQLSLEHKECDLESAHPDRYVGLDVKSTNLKQGDPGKLQIDRCGATLILTECSAAPNQACRIRADLRR